MNQALYFLKLGGSLITDKQQQRTLLPDVLQRLANEIAAALAARPQLKLVLGHGSGSFGHVPARKYGTRQGVSTSEQWRGFSEVWKEASLLNRHVIDALFAVGLTAIAFPPSAGLLARDGQVLSWDIAALEKALQAGLLPVVFGDVVFDQVLGGTIFSTEDLFVHLAQHLRPQRLLLAGLEAGVYADYPVCKQLLQQITPQTYEQVAGSLAGSAGTDVTGGMQSKVSQMLTLVDQLTGLEVCIFSGSEPGLVQRALDGERLGTCLHGLNILP